MAKQERTRRERTEEPEAADRQKKKTGQPIYDQLKAPDEGAIDFQAEPSMDRHAALLAGTKSDTQRANLMIQLQQSYGNAYVQRLLKSRVVQAKLTVNPPDDVYEREADRVASEIQRQPIEEEEEELQMKVASDIQRQEEEEELQMKIASEIQRQPIEEEEEELQMKIAPEIQRQEEEEEMLQMKTTSEIQRQPIEEEEEELQMKVASEIQRQEEEEEEMLQMKASSDSLETQIDAARGGGQPLSESARVSLEPRLGHDFSGVSVHTDADADRLSRKLGAEAFTTGKDIFFREGTYKPDTESGKGLIAHELTHVVQQQAAPALQRQ